MTPSPLDAHEPAPSRDEEAGASAALGGAGGSAAVGGAGGSAAVGEADGSAADGEGERAFGAQSATRFAADVEYRGRAGEHDYIVRVRHRLLDTSFTLSIDGIEHDPKVETEARKAREEHEGSEKGSDGEEALQFGLEDGFSTLRCTVRRPREDGEVEDGEVITIRTAGLGGAGEVEVRHGVRTTVLVPPEGSPSALRDEKRTAHPTRYALVAALTKSAKFLIPLLGLGALLSGLLDPVTHWVEARIRPAVEAIVQATQPVREWIGEVARPVQEFLDALLTPVRELFAAILRPIGDALRWLLGLLPDIGLPFSVLDWLPDVLVPVLVVVAVFVATYSRLTRRREKLAETATRSERTPSAGETERPAPKGEAEGAAPAGEAQRTAPVSGAGRERGATGAEDSGDEGAGTDETV